MKDVDAKIADALVSVVVGVEEEDSGRTEALLYLLGLAAMIAQDDEDVLLRDGERFAAIQVALAAVANATHVCSQFALMQSEALAIEELGFDRAMEIVKMVREDLGIDDEGDDADGIGGGW